MSKKSLLTKRVLSALVLGSMLYAPAAMAKDVSYSGSQTITESVYGNKSSTGPADSNKVTITNCTIDPTQIQDEDLIIVGGAVENVNGEKSRSTASKNTVKIGESVVVTGITEDNDVHYYVDVYGGMIVYGDASENKVTVESGSFYDIIGGEVYYEIEGEGDEHDEEFGNGNVSKNIVRVSTTGSFEDVIGGETKEGNATLNEVYVANGTSKEQSSGDNEPPAIAGGMSWKGNANSNKVEITGGNFDATVDGGLAVGNANNNTVSFSNATMKILNPRSEETGIGISGGWGIIEKDDAEALTDKSEQVTANNNTVTVSKATVGSATSTEVATDMYIVGGAVTTEESELFEDAKEEKGYEGPDSIRNSDDLVGTASNNTVTIKDGSKIYVDIFGGVLDGGKGTVSKNTVTIKDSTIYSTTDEAGENAIYGGYVEYGNAEGSSVTGNSVTITNSTIGVKVYGGYADSGVVSGNSVSIANSTVNNGADIYGGYVDGTGEEKNNSVSLDGVTFVGDGSGTDETRIYGGRHEGGSGNSLHIGADGFTVSENTNVTIKRFDTMTFADGAVVTNNGNLTFEQNGDAENPNDIVWTAKITGTGTTHFSHNDGVNSDFTLGNELSTSGGIEVAEGAKLRVLNAGYLGADVTNSGDVNLYSGTLAQVITNNDTVKIKGDVALTSGANIAGGTLQLKEGGHLMLNNGSKDTLTVDTLEAYSKDDKGSHDYSATDNKISFDAGFGAEAVKDQILANNYMGTFTLGTISLSDGFEGEVDETNTYQLFKADANYDNTFAINGSASAVFDGYKYTFEAGETKGSLKVTKGYGYELTEIIQNNDQDRVAGQVSSYSLNEDKTMNANMGTLARTNSQVARDFTINGNNHKLLGNGKAGITVNSGDTLTYKDIKEVSGFSGAAVTNKGTFNANNVTFKNEIAGSGTMNVNGVVNADAKVANRMNIESTGTLNIAGANMGNTVANAGNFNFLGGNLNYAVTGSGTTNVKEDATFNAKVDNKVVIDAGKILNTSAGNLGGDVTVTGNLNVTGSGTIANAVNGSGALVINSGVDVTFGGAVDVQSFTNNGTMNIAASNLQENLVNNYVLNLGSGKVTDEITGSGKTYVKGDVIADAAINQEMNVESGSLTFANASNVGGAVTVAANTFLALNGDTLGQNVSGQGEVRIGGEVTASANNLDVVVDNSGVFNVSGGTFKKVVKGTGTMNVQGDAIANADVTAGTINVADGKALTVNGNLSAETISLTNADLTVAEGKNLTVTAALNMTGNGTKVTLDKGDVLNSELAVKTGLGEIIKGTAGELALRFNGAEYTATQYKTAKDALFGTGENAVLTFAGGVLTIDEDNETLGVQGTKTDNVVTMSGAQPTVYNKSGGKVEDVGGQAERTVGILTEDGKLESADKVSLEGNSNVTAKDLQIKEVATAEAFAIEVKGGSNLNLTGGANGLVKDKDGNAVKLDVAVEANSVVTLGSEDEKLAGNKADVKELNVAGTVNVRNIDLNINKLKVNGGKVVFDPTYSKVTTLDFGSGTVQVVTDGTVVNVGMDKDALKAALDSAGLATTASNDGYIVANGHGVLALGSQVDLTGGSKHLVVDEDGAIVTEALQLGAGAVLVVEKSSTTVPDTPVVVLSNKTDVSIDDTAQLVISADKYQEDGGDFISYIVLDKEADSLWAEGNIYAADPTFTFKYDETIKKLVADWNKVEGIFGENAIFAPEMYNRILQKEQNTDANKFLKDVISDNASAGSTAATKAAGAAALNAVTSLGELAAVNHGLYTVSNQMTDAVANHMSLVDNEEAGRDIWAAYVHNKEDVDGLKLGGVDADYSAKYNGVVVGADLSRSDNATFGVALSYVDGDISGATAGVRTKNDAEYYGASVYGRIDGKAVSLLGDISYMHGKGDVTQTAMGQEITADTKSNSFSIGLRAEKAFQIGKFGNVLPYVGVRYMQISTDDYNNNLGMNYDIDNQGLIMAPVGIAYSAHIEDNGWTYKPTIEAGYVFNMGDKNVDQKVSYNGYGDSFGMDIVDSGYWFGRVGFAAESKRMAYSLGYQYMKSDSAKNSKYMVNVAWKF